jgi:hypothetical protein
VINQFFYLVIKYRFGYDTVQWWGEKAKIVESKTVLLEAVVSELFKVNILTKLDIQHYCSFSSYNCVVFWNQSIWDGILIYMCK